MKVNIEITKVYYHGEKTGTDDFNAKVLYKKNGKTYLAHVYVDFFNRYIHEGANQPKECKVLHGLMTAVNQYAIKTNWLF